MGESEFSIHIQPRTLTTKALNWILDIHQITLTIQLERLIADHLTLKLLHVLFEICCLVDFRWLNILINNNIFSYRLCHI